MGHILTVPPSVHAQQSHWPETFQFYLKCKIKTDFSTQLTITKAT